MVHTPVHASWLNQIEIYFSIVQRKVLSPNDFTDIDAVSDRLSAFENRYNQTAQPFKWKLRRIPCRSRSSQCMSGRSDPSRGRPDIHCAAV